MHIAIEYILKKNQNKLYKKKKTNHVRKTFMEFETFNLIYSHLQIF